MPIQTNFAIETAFFHVPIPATRAQVRRLNSIWRKQPPRNGRIVARYVARGLILEAAKPVVLLAVADQYWRELGQLIKQTGEPWWDLFQTAEKETARSRPLTLPHHSKR